MSSGYRDGWALRRDGGCKGNEHGEPTWDNWVYCCPIEMTRSTDIDNNKRCTIRTSPSRSASTPRRCADPTMSLWSDSEGYFCCDSDLLGFRNDQYYKGCATESEIQKNGSWTKDDPEGQPSGKSKVQCCGGTRLFVTTQRLPRLKSRIRSANAIYSIT
jgi:hypothetical protein